MDRINNMEVNPDGAVWGSPLGAHTILSNLYATNGKQDDVVGIRTSLEMKEQRKSRVMEQKQSSDGGSVCHQLPPLSAKHPWFVAQNLGADEDSFRDQYFYTLHDPLTKYQCQIPELLGRRIRGYYHGWVILSDHLQNVMWSLWNPVTSKMIHFPPLILNDGDSESILECCLSAPPDDPSSVLL
ncbi:hypothetical protein Tco_0941484, partial [Tanacetum coccineum]